MRLNRSLALGLFSAALAAGSGTHAPSAASTTAYAFTAGSGDYRVQFNYTDVQVVLLTADAHNANDANPLPGAQMLVTGLHERDAAWEEAIQQRIAPFYVRVGLGNRGPRVRGGGSEVEGSSQAWHPLIERAAEYTPAVSIMEVSRAIDIEDRVGRIENGRDWAADLFDGVSAGMAAWACSKGMKTGVCR